MRNRVSTMYIVAGLAAVSVPASAQQSPAPPGELPECALARQLYAQHRVVEARNWQRVCQEKRRAASSASPGSARPLPQSNNPIVPTSAAVSGPGQAALAPRPASGPSEVPPARSGITPEQDPGWLDNLPSIDDVKSAIRGPDSAVRQEAAFAVLREYIEQHRGEGSLFHGAHGPGTAEVRWMEYFNAVSGDQGKAYRISPAAKELFDRPAFKTEILSKFKKSEVAKTTIARLENDKKSARDNHVDINVFGIPLGEPLQLPPCTDQTSQLCVSAEDTGKAQVLGLLTAMADISVAGFSSGSPVKLPRSKCPKWVFGCTVQLDLQAGIPVGAFVQTTSDIDAVDDALVEKYGKTVRLGKHTTCSNNLTSIVTADVQSREWSLPGLLVVYNPIVECNLRMGTVLVKLRRVDEEAEKRKKESQPKL